MKKELSRFGAVVSLVAVAVVIVNVAAWAYVSVVGADYDSASFRETLVEGENGNWYTPSGQLFVDGTCTSGGGCEASHVIK